MKNSKSWNRSIYPAAAMLAILTTVSAMASQGGPNGGNRCEVTNASVDLDAQLPTLLLEGDLCDAAKTPTVWLSRDGSAEPVSLLSSGETSILVDVTGFEFVQDARVWVVCGNGKPSSGCSMDLLINRDDADADPANEIQRIERSGVEVCLVGPDGGCANIEDADASPTNELQELSRGASEICLSESGCVPDQVQDADADPGNEIQVLSQEGSTVSLSKGGGSVEIGGGRLVTTARTGVEDLCEFEEIQGTAICYSSCECTAYSLAGSTYARCSCQPEEPCVPSKTLTATCSGESSVDCRDTGEELMGCINGSSWNDPDGCTSACSVDGECEAVGHAGRVAESSCGCVVEPGGSCTCTASGSLWRTVSCTPDPVPCTLDGPTAMCGKVI